MIDYCHRALARLDLAAELPDDEALAEFREATEDLQAEGLTWAAVGQQLAASLPQPVQATVDPGPIFLDLRYSDLRDNDRDLLDGIEDYWLTKGRLSEKQAQCVVRIASGSGLTVSADGMTGTSLAEWREAHQHKLSNIEAVERENAVQLWTERFNDIKAFLEEAEAGQAIVSAYVASLDMADLAERVSALTGAVDLAVNVKDTALKLALRGQGSRANKVALALLMGHPPSTLWPAQPDRIRRLLSELRSGLVTIEMPEWFERADAVLGTPRASASQVERERDDTLYLECLQGAKASGTA